MNFLEIIIDAAFYIADILQALIFLIFNSLESLLFSLSKIFEFVFNLLINATSTIITFINNIINIFV